MVQPFPPDLAAIYNSFAIFLWILSEIVGSGIIPYLRRRGTKIERRDRGSQLLIIGFVILSIVISSLFASRGIALFPAWVSYVGTTLILVGIVIRQWAIAVLGGFFSAAVGIQKGQKVVTRGPYRLVRHPSYSGILLIVLGVSLSYRSPGAIIVNLFLVGLALGYRINLEEKVMVSELGDEYVQYMKRTKRLIPYIL
jgi:protein-S-isoprenylcysteine O-methyltransferase Ste14